MDRRAFLYTTALGAGALIAPEWALAKKKKKLPADSESSGAPLPTPHSSALIRVLLLDNAATIAISARGLKDVSDGEKTPLDESVMLARVGDSVAITNASPPLKKKWLKLIARDPIDVTGRQYRGAIEVWPAPGGGLALVNEVDFEEYLASVLGSEMDATWPVEALKAQAVLARTYAEERRRRPKIQVVPSYDVVATVQDQVYKGVVTEAESTIQAAQESRGEIIGYGGGLGQVFYHSTCGGRTLAARQVWGADIPYLQGVECGFCEDSPRYFWTYTAPLEDLRILMVRHKLTVDALLGIIADTTTSLDPVTRVTVRARPRELTLTGADLRRIVGYNYLFSTRFVIREEAQEGALTFLGSGAGHGVGMCQWGARGMGAEGIDYRAIIRKYFPGAEIASLY